jgi:DNA-directed RNA polymerase specialized sigma24 family protein
MQVSELIAMLYAQNIPLQEAARKMNLTDEEVKSLINKECKKKMEEARNAFRNKLLNFSLN